MKNMVKYWFLAGAGALVYMATTGVASFLIVLIGLPVMNGSPPGSPDDAAQWLFYTIWIAVIAIAMRIAWYNRSFDPEVQESPWNTLKCWALVLMPLILWGGRESLTDGELFATLWLNLTLALYELQVMRAQVDDLCRRHRSLAR